jgi:copper homeostasis protein
MPGRVLLEVCVESPAGARAAHAGGADRLELCADLAQDGLTPPPGALAAVRDACPLPVWILVRPRPGSFVLDDAELGLVRAQMEAARRAGADGLVIGALAPDNGLPLPALAGLVRSAGGVPLTFHRAFDHVADPHTALEQLIALGFARVLTAGGPGRAADHAPRLAALVRQAAGRIVVMPGGGVRAAGAAALRRTTGATEFHSAARRTGSADAERDEVAALREALDRG